MDAVLTEAIIEQAMEEAGIEATDTLLEGDEPLPPVEVVEPALTEAQVAERMQQAALQIARQLAQIAQTGERIVMLLVNPTHHAPFEAAFHALPEAVIPPDFRDRLPILADEACEGVRIITQTDLANEYLLRHFGPTDQGGNGLIAALEEAVTRIPNCPVRLDLKTLEVLFFLELKERVRPGILVPTGASLTQGLQSHGQHPRRR